MTAVPLAAALAAPAILAQSGGDQPPVAKKVRHVTDIHGTTLTDDYFWLRQKGTPEVTAYLEAENAYTEGVMKPTKALQDTLYAEMLGRIKQTDLSVPSRIGDYMYYSRTEEGKQYPYMCRRKGSMSGAEEILLDLNKLAEGHKFLGLGGYAVSDDANWLAYSVDTTGYRQYTLHVKDLRTGQLSTEKIERTRSDRLGDRQQDAVLLDRGSGLEARRQGLPPRRRDRGQRSDLRREGRAVRRRRRTIARQEDRVRRIRSEDVERDSVCPGRYAGGGAETDPGPPGRPRVRRRPLQRRVLHHHEQGSEELQGGQGAARRSIGEELEALHRAQAGIADRRPLLLRQPPGRIGARGRAELPAGHRHEDAAVAPHRHRRGRLRAGPRYQSRVQHDDRPIQLSVDGHPVVGVRIRPAEPAANAAQAPGRARRLHAGELRVAANLGGGTRRHQGAGVDRLPQRHEVRRQRADAAVLPTDRTAPRRIRRSRPRA